MEMKQTMGVLMMVVSCLLLAGVWCEQQEGGELQDGAGSQPQKRSVDVREDSEGYPAALYTGADDTDKRGSLFRFGKRGSLFRFGKRGSLFRFGKRGSLFRFGKRGSLFRFGKRDNDLEFESEMYPDGYLPYDVKAAQWDRYAE